MFDILDSLLRVVLGFAVLLLLIRLTGNKQLGQLNVFTYISGITIGSMIGEVVLHKDIELSLFLSIATWVFLVFATELISMKSTKARELLDGQPVILIKNGIIQYDSLKKERLNIDDLTMMLRTNMIFSILDVDYAILESNGVLSILKKKEKMNVTKEDLDVSVTPTQYIPTSLIVDSKILAKNLIETGLSKNWLNNAIKRAGVQSNSDILYAELQNDGQLYMQLYNGSIKIG